MRLLVSLSCLLLVSCKVNEDPTPDAGLPDITIDTTPPAPLYCDPSTPDAGPDAGDGSCVECRDYSNPEACNEHPECEWYYCTSRNPIALGCYPKVGNHATYCIGPCEYWTDQTSCNAALRCLWFTDKCRSANVSTDLAADEPDPPCHERKDATACGEYSICAEADCASHLSDLDFTCWLLRQGGDEQYAKGCLEQRCENLLNEAACASRETACEWRDDGWCHPK